MFIKVTKLIGITLKMLENGVEVDKVVIDDSTGEVIFEVNDNNEIVITENLLDHLIDEFEQECEEQRTVAYLTGRQIGYKEGYETGHKDAVEEIFPTDELPDDVELDVKDFD